MQVAKKNRNDRRETLLRTAETLFASKGIDAVSLNEINKAAGQKNTSAMHYHFGSKEKLLETIIYEEFDGIVAQMNCAFDQLEAKAHYSGDDVIAAVMTPFVDFLDTERGNNYLNIMVQLLDRSANMPFKTHPDKVEAVKLRAFKLAQPYYCHLPDGVVVTRLIMFGTLLFRSLVAYTQFDAQPGPNIAGNREVFVSELRGALARLIFAPLSTATEQALSKQ